MVIELGNLYLMQKIRRASMTWMTLISAFCLASLYEQYVAGKPATDNAFGLDLVILALSLGLWAPFRHSKRAHTTRAQHAVAAGFYTILAACLLGFALRGAIMR